jgi:hypothetical protein
MHETNGVEIGDILGSFFLDEGNVGGVEPMKIVGVEIRELISNRYDIYLDCVPTRFEEGSCNAIQSLCFVNSGVLNRAFNLFLHKMISRPTKIALQCWNC